MVLMDLQLLGEIEEARGRVPRGAFIRGVLEDALHPATVTTTYPTTSNLPLSQMTARALSPVPKSVMVTSSALDDTHVHQWKRAGGLHAPIVCSVCGATKPQENP